MWFEVPHVRTMFRKCACNVLNGCALSGHCVLPEAANAPLVFRMCSADARPMLLKCRSANALQSVHLLRARAGAPHARNWCATTVPRAPLKCWSNGPQLCLW